MLRVAQRQFTTLGHVARQQLNSSMVRQLATKTPSKQPDPRRSGLLALAPFNAGNITPMQGPPSGMKNVLLRRLPPSATEASLRQLLEGARGSEKSSGLLFKKIELEDGYVK
jgi:hypothetical protein